jgi:hypothetical protein
MAADAQKKWFTRANFDGREPTQGIVINNANPIAQDIRFNKQEASLSYANSRPITTS